MDLTHGLEFLGGNDAIIQHLLLLYLGCVVVEVSEFPICRRQFTELFDCSSGQCRVNTAHHVGLNLRHSCVIREVTEDLTYLIRFPHIIEGPVVLASGTTSTQQINGIVVVVSESLVECVLHSSHRTGCPRSFTPTHGISALSHIRVPAQGVVLLPKQLYCLRSITSDITELSVGRDVVRDTARFFPLRNLSSFTAISGCFSGKCAELSGHAEGTGSGKCEGTNKGGSAQQIHPQGLLRPLLLHVLDAPRPAFTVVCDTYDSGFGAEQEVKGFHAPALCRLLNGASYGVNLRPIQAQSRNIRRSLEGVQIELLTVWDCINHTGNAVIHNTINFSGSAKSSDLLRLLTGSQ